MSLSPIGSSPHFSATPALPSPSLFVPTTQRPGVPQTSYAAFWLRTSLFKLLPLTVTPAHCQVLEHCLRAWPCAMCWGHSGDAGRLSPSGMVAPVMRQGTYKWPCLLSIWKALGHRPPWPRSPPLCTISQFSPKPGLNQSPSSLSFYQTFNTFMTAPKILL